jgi:hypothetical protein
MCKGSWFEDCYFSLGMVVHCYFPLEGLDWVGIGFPQLGILLRGVPTLSLVPILSFLPVIIGLVRWIGHIQLFKILNLLKRGRLDEIDPCLVLSMWGYNRLGRTWKGIIWVTLWGSIWVVRSGGGSIITRWI